MIFTRRQFVKISGVTLTGLILGLEGCSDSGVWVKGNVYDLLGNPVQGALISLVTGYSLKESELNFASTLAPAVSTDALGAFAIFVRNTQSDVALRLILTDEVQRIQVRKVTGTLIPFYNVEVWSPISIKWINDLNQAGELNTLEIYIDPSRTYIWNYFSQNHPELINLLQNVAPDTGVQAWEGNHHNPDDPEHWNNGNSDEHYGYPRSLDRTRKINLPWGIGPWGVIPFVNAEGFVFHTTTEKKNESLDGDWEWDMVLEPQYSYLPNADNAKLEAQYEPTAHKELALHCEMCNWFMGRKNSNEPTGFEEPKTNIGRSDDLTEFNDSRRVWILGSWTVDDGHHDFFQNPTELHNEIHTIYWVVPFIGGWRRFYAAELIWLGIETGSLSLINAALNSPPQTLLDTLGSTFYLFLSAKNNHSHADAEQFYSDTVVHLNKFGLNFYFPNAGSTLPVNIATGGGNQLDEMKAVIEKMYTRIYIHLTTLGSGVFVFPIMFFPYEGTEILQQADSIPLQRPLGLNTSYNSRIEVSLAKQALSLGANLYYDGRILLELAYADIFNTMKNNNIPAEQIAEYYATTAIRLISYGIYLDNDPKNSAQLEDHRSIALQYLLEENGIISLINNTKVRIDDLWNDAFPFTRKT